MSAPTTPAEYARQYKTIVVEVGQSAFIVVHWPHRKRPSLDLVNGDGFLLCCACQEEFTAIGYRDHLQTHTRRRKRPYPVMALTPDGLCPWPLTAAEGGESYE